MFANLHSLIRSDVQRVSALRLRLASSAVGSFRLEPFVELTVFSMVAWSAHPTNNKLLARVIALSNLNMERHYKQN